jgi:hypothetical protein
VVLATDPGRITMDLGEILPIEFNVSALLPAAVSIEAVECTLTRIDPLPAADAPDTWEGTLDFATDPQVIVQYVDSTDLSEGYIYRLDATFDYTDLDLIRQTVTTIIEINTVTAVNTRGMSRLEIRQMAGMGTGDLIVARASQDGTNVQFYDDGKLLRPREEYVGRRIYFVGGTAENLGKIRRIISASSASGLVQWSSTLPAATQEGDIAELWGRHELGWEPDDVNRFIAQAHLEASSHFQISATAELGAFSASSPSLSIPSSFVAVTGVEWYDESIPHTTDWTNLDKARNRNGPGYWVDKANRTVLIAGNPRRTLDSKTVRLRGYIKERPLEYDADVTNLNVEWIVARVKELMFNQLSMRTDNIQVAMSMAAQFRQEAMVKRTMVMPRRAANVDWIG